MSSLTLDEIRTLKRIAEENIIKIIGDFTKETGVSVNSVSAGFLEHKQTDGAVFMVRSLKLDIAWEG